jgi:hypothetical protein
MTAGRSMPSASSGCGGPRAPESAAERRNRPVGKGIGEAGNSGDLRGGLELRLPLPDVVAMQTRQPNLEGIGKVRLHRPFEEALRIRPERMIVGEIRQEKRLDLLIDLNFGSVVNPMRPL